MVDTSNTYMPTYTSTPVGSTFKLSLDDMLEIIYDSFEAFEDTVGDYYIKNLLQQDAYRDIMVIGAALTNLASSGNQRHAYELARKILYKDFGVNLDREWIAIWVQSMVGAYTTFVDYLERSIYSRDGGLSSEDESKFRYYQAMFPQVSTAITIANYIGKPIGGSNANGDERGSEVTLAPEITQTKDL